MTDVVLDGLRLVVLAVFATLAVRSYRRWRGEAGEAAAWLSASFAVLAVVALLGVVWSGQLARDQGRWPWKVTAAVLLLFPYCLSMFTASMQAVARRRVIVTRAVTGLVVAWTLVMPAPHGGGRPPFFRIFVVVVLVEWTTISVLAAARLWSGARREPAVARRRLRTLGAGSLLVNVAVVTRVLALATAPNAAQVVGLLFGLASAWFFFVGFSPPRTLRALWRQGELAGFHRAQAELITALDPEAVGRVIVAQTVALFGARTAVMTAADGRILAAEGSGATPGTGMPDPVTVRVPLRGGWLALEASPAAPLFGLEENELLQALCDSAGLALDRAELFARDAANRDALGQRERQLAQAQRLARIGSWEWDVDSGRVDWSAEMYRLYDLEPDALGGDAGYTWFRSRSHPDDTGAMEAAVRGAVAGGGRFELTHRILDRAGRVRWLHSRGQTDCDAAGRVVRLTGTAQEVTARKEFEEQLKAGARQQAALAQLGQRALRGLDLVALFQDAVGVAADILGLDRAEVFEASSPDGALVFRAGIGSSPDGGAFPVDGAAELRHLAALEFGEPVATAGAAVVPIPGPAGPFGVLAVESATADTFGPTEVDVLTSVANILAAAVQRHHTESVLAHQALHDPLTGLPNRALLLDRLAQAAARAGRHPSAMALLFLDLDRFKVVNDGLGHRAGDDLLQAVANRLLAVVRPDDTVARLGGDEFVVLCEHLQDEAQATGLAARIAEVLERPVTVAGRDVNVSASIGIVLADAGTVAAEELLRDADTAMYQAKERGRARYVVFDAPARRKVMERLETEVALRRAVDRGQLRLHYQPEISLEDGRIVAVEALLRWEHPDRGLQLPGQFLALAEETGLIVPIGEWVLEEACRNAGALRQADPGLESLLVWVNLSSRQLIQPGLPETIARILSETGVDPTTLGLEITESDLMEDTRLSGETLRTLRRLGVRIAIDDFGTGFSSLSRLRSFPVDILKIDRSFVAGIGTDEGDSAIVRAVVGLAHSLGMSVVAEGVESWDQAAALRAMGCNLGQGFYFSPPVDSHALGALLPVGFSPSPAG